MNYDTMTTLDALRSKLQSGVLPELREFLQREIADRNDALIYSDDDVNIYRAQGEVIMLRYLINKFYTGDDTWENKRI